MYRVRDSALRKGESIKLTHQLETKSHAHKSSQVGRPLIAPGGLLVEHFDQGLDNAKCRLS